MPNIEYYTYCTGIKAYGAHSGVETSHEGVHHTKQFQALHGGYTPPGHAKLSIAHNTVPQQEQNEWKRWGLRRTG
jgi:hypothetical protein